MAVARICDRLIPAKQCTNSQTFINFNRLLVSADEIPISLRGESRVTHLESMNLSKALFIPMGGLQPMGTQSPSMSAIYVNYI